MSDQTIQLSLEVLRLKAILGEAQHEQQQRRERIETLAVELALANSRLDWAATALSEAGIAVPWLPPDALGAPPLTPLPDAPLPESAPMKRASKALN